NNGYIEIVKELIKSGADVNLKDSGGHTALTYTVFSDVGHSIEIKKELAKILIENGSLLNFESFDNISYGGQIDPNFKGVSFLEYVINDLEFLEVIAKNLTKSFDMPMNPLGDTPLIYAIKSNSNLDVLEFILKQTKNVNLPDNENKTALEHALNLRSDRKIIELLTQYGAK
ncbi:MAG: ankyrin repeat domain-containing protein, partial [Cyanobacteriota bacterium]